MALDLETYSPEALERFRVVGERYSSGVALAQADKTLAACERHREGLVQFGFGPDDEQTLVDGRQESRLQQTEHAQADGSRKAVTATFSDTRDSGRHERRAGRTVLGRGANELLKLRDYDNARAAQAILKVTRATPKDDALPVHLETLLAALQQPAMAAVLARRGGPETVGRIQGVLAVLQPAMEEKSASSPVMLASQRRDILDGLLVSLCRDAYAAARLLGRALKQPAIAAEFSLTHLKRSRKTAAPAPDAPAPPAPDVPGAPVEAPGAVPAPADPLTP